MLDRIGDEVARATTLVRFAPGSYFDAHTHGGGEEFLVLDGVFSDETSDFPVGSYVRNPIGTAHKPHTEPGCTIFVKLYQFDAEDSELIRIDTNTAEFAPSGLSGVDELPLHQYGGEAVRMLRLAAETSIALDATGGLEVLVVDGKAVEGDTALAPHSWLRRPSGSVAISSQTGCTLFVKSGHLPD